MSAHDEDHTGGPEFAKTVGSDKKGRGAIGSGRKGGVGGAGYVGVDKDGGVDVDKDGDVADGSLVGEDKVEGGGEKASDGRKRKRDDSVGVRAPSRRKKNKPSAAMGVEDTPADTPLAGDEGNEGKRKSKRTNTKRPKRFIH